MPSHRQPPLITLSLSAIAIFCMSALLLAVGGDVHLASATPVGPDAPLQGGGSSGDGGDMLLSTVPDLDRVPSVAYNTVDNEFLVVWASLYKVVGQRYDQRGVPIGESIQIADLSEWSSGPHVEHTSSLNRYLVVWDDEVGADYDVFGRLLEADGQLVNELLPIADSPGHQREPSVTATASDFFVVWQGNHADDSTDIAGRAISSSSLMYDAWAVAGAGTAHYRSPVVAWDALGREYLVVFEYGELHESELRARRFNVEGPLGDEFAVPTSGITMEADVVAGGIGDGGAWFVVWKSYDGVDEAAAARIVLSGSDGSFAGPEFTIDTAEVRPYRSRVTWLGAARRYLVVWEADDPRGFGADLMAQLYAENGATHGSPFEVVGTSANRTYADLASGTEPEQAFVVWEDRRTTDVNIGAQRLDPDGSRLWYEMTVSAAPGKQAAPAVACDPDDNQCLAVWENDEAVGTSIIGQRLDVTGRPLEGPWMLEGDLNDNVEPDVVYNAHSRSYLVIWADVQTAVVEGRRVFPGGNTTVKVEVADSLGGRRPRVVYNATDGRQLVAWDAHGDVFAHLLEWDGLSIGPDSARVAAGVTTQEQPVVAHDTTRNGYLVIWRGGTAGAEDLYGQLLNAEARLAGDPFLVAGGGDDSVPRYSADVAYDVRTRSFLVAYVAQVKSKEGDIRAQQLSFDGDRIGNEAIVRDKPDGADQFGPQVDIAEDTGRYHVVWTERRPSPAGDATGQDLVGRWLQPSGAPVGAVLPVFRYAGDQRGLRTAPGVDAGDVMMVWEDTRRGKAGDIYGMLSDLDTEPPTARFRIDPSVGPVGTTFTFDARGSRDTGTPTGALSVRWDWTSDGQYDTSWSLTKSVTRTIATAGTYTVTLAVRDAAGQTATASRPVQVVAGTINTPPEAIVHSEPASGQAGDPFVFDAAASTDRETAHADLEARWDWEDDGVFDTDWDTSKRLKHPLTEAGANRIRVEVRDEGGLTDSAVALVQVSAGPTVRLEISPGTATLYPGDVVRYFAATWDEYGNAAPNAKVQWSVTNGAAGTIDARGVFTAGIRVGVFADVVLAVDGEGSDAASVTVVEREAPTDTPEPGVTPTATRTPTRGPSPTPSPTATAGPSPTTDPDGGISIYLPDLRKLE